MTVLEERSNDCQTPKELTEQKYIIFIPHLAGLLQQVKNKI